MNLLHLPIQTAVWCCVVVTDSGNVQGMSRKQMDALEQLLVEVCADLIRPPIRPTILRKEIKEGSPFLLVEVPQGHTQHDSPGGSYHRVGSSKRRMTSDEQLRLAHSSAGRHDSSGLINSRLRELDLDPWTNRFGSLY